MKLQERRGSLSEVPGEAGGKKWERAGPEPEAGNRLFHWSGVEGGFVVGGG